MGGGTSRRAAQGKGKQTITTCQTICGGPGTSGTKRIALQTDIDALTCGCIISSRARQNAGIRIHVMFCITAQTICGKASIASYTRAITAETHVSCSYIFACCTGRALNGRVYTSQTRRVASKALVVARLKKLAISAARTL